MVAGRPRTKSPRGDLAGVVPGALASYDLPDLAAALAPTRLTIREPLGPSGDSPAKAVIDAAYERCRSAYEAAGAAGSLTIAGGR